MGANFVSSVVDLQQVWVYSLQASWTGAPVGEFKLQGSNDIIPTLPTQDYPISAPVNWSTISGSISSTTAIGSSNFLWSVDSPSYRWVRLVFTSQTASGTLTVNGLCKGI